MVNNTVENFQEDWTWRVGFKLRKMLVFAKYFDCEKQKGRWVGEQNTGIYYPIFFHNESFVVSITINSANFPKLSYRSSRFKWFWTIWRKGWWNVNLITRNYSSWKRKRNYSSGSTPFQTISYVWKKHISASMTSRKTKEETSFNIFKRLLSLQPQMACMRIKKSFSACYVLPSQVNNTVCFHSFLLLTLPR